MKKENRAATPSWRNRIDATRRRGATVVEFALAFPILLVLVIGLIEFARLHNLRHAADNAAYEAARCVVVPGASVNDATDEANDLLARAGVTDATVIVTPSPIREDTDSVTVRVEVPFDKNSWLPPALTNNRTVARETTLMTERVPVIQARAVPSPPPPPPPPPPPSPEPDPEPDPVPPPDDDDDDDDDNPPPPPPEPEPEPEPEPDPDPDPGPPPPAI